MPPLNRDSASHPIPTSFGSFRVLHQIGEGALGPVLRTYEPEADRLVAVKIFRLDITPEQAEELARELAAISQRGLAHPSIVEPLAAGVEDGIPYLATEYVAAESLDVAMRHYAPASFETALAFVTQLADALDFAHAAGVAHGALHPRDVFVTPERARVTGFGIVRALEQIGWTASVRRPYSAPELIAGGVWGPPADIYALAAIVHELLTGRRVTVTDESLAAVMAEAIGGSRAAPLAEVLARALADAPDRRYPTALEFASALEWALAGEVGTLPRDAEEATSPGAASPPPPRPHTETAGDPADRLLGDEVSGAGEPSDREVPPADRVESAVADAVADPGAGGAAGAEPEGREGSEDASDAIESDPVAENWADVELWTAGVTPAPEALPAIVGDAPPRVEEGEPDRREADAPAPTHRGADPTGAGDEELTIADALRLMEKDPEELEERLRLEEGRRSGAPETVDDAPEAVEAAPEAVEAASEAVEAASGTPSLFDDDDEFDEIFESAGRAEPAPDAESAPATEYDADARVEPAGADAGTSWGQYVEAPTPAVERLTDYWGAAFQEGARVDHQRGGRSRRPHTPTRDRSGHRGKTTIGYDCAAG